MDAKQLYEVKYTDENDNQKVAVFETKTDADEFMLALQDVRLRNIVQRISAKYPELRSRAIRAAYIWADGSIATWPNNATRYSVCTENHVDDTFNVYTVYLNGSHTCTCPDFTKGNAPHGYCKHVLASQMQKKYGLYDTHQGKEDFAPLA